MQVSPTTDASGDKASAPDAYKPAMAISAALAVNTTTFVVGVFLALAWVSVLTLSFNFPLSGKTFQRLVFDRTWAQPNGTMVASGALHSCSYVVRDNQR